MLVLKQNNSGFVDLDKFATVYVVQSGINAGRIEAASAYGKICWLGDYESVERANAVFMQLYAAMKAGANDFAMPPKKECNADYCDI